MAIAWPTVSDGYSTGNAPPEDLAWLDELCTVNHYAAPQVLPGGRWAALSPFAFTTAIITGQLWNDYVYENRWCFDGFDLAAKALLEWKERGFVGEPEGWHRHPFSGRRRPDGDPAKEYVEI